MEKVKELLEKQMELLSEQTQNQVCSAQDIVNISFAMAEIAKVIQYPIFVQEANQASRRCLKES